MFVPPGGRVVCVTHVDAPGSSQPGVAVQAATRAADAGHPGPVTDGADIVAEAVARLAAPGLVVLAGPAGIGRTSALRRVAAAFRGPVFAGGGLAMLQGVPGLALARAVRVRLPVHDVALLAEAVRSRVRGGLLVIDDLQWVDQATVAALPAIAVHCRIAVSLRTPHRLPPAVEAQLRAVAGAWLPVPPMPAPVATALVRQLAPGAATAVVTDVVRRAGGVPLAVTALARAAARRHPGSPTAGPGSDDTGSIPLPGAAGPRPGSAAAGAGPADGTDALAQAVAAALADLTRPARTAMAALGLLGRPAPAAVLGDGAGELLSSGLAETLTEPASPTGPTAGSTPVVAAVSAYVAEVAAGLLAPAERQALHRRLADLVTPREAARHLAAAGEPDLAYRTAVDAAGATTSTAERAELLLLACGLPDVVVAPSVRVAAARAALQAGRPGACLRVLGREPAGVAEAAGIEAAEIAVLRGEALLQTGSPGAAVAAVAGVGDSDGNGNGNGSAGLSGARDRVRLLGLLAADPQAAVAGLDAVLARHGDPPAHAGLRAAVAAVRAAVRQPGWEYGLASAAAVAGDADDALAARWSAWLLVETLAADGRLAEAAHAASAAAQACAADLAYSWQTRFVAAALWCTALRGADIDGVVRRAGDLTDRTLPAAARGYAVAAASLAEADGGLLAPARARLAAAGRQPPSTAAILDWVAREAAWLDGQPELAVAPPPATDPAERADVPLVDGLRRITARWAAHDARSGDGAVRAHPDGASSPAGPLTGDPADGDLPPAASRIVPVAQTLRAWAANASPDGFDTAAAAWHDLARREEVRCLLAHGLLETESTRAVPPLLRAEQLAGDAGLVVLLGRARRALRRHAVRRETRGRRAGDELTDRERDVLRLVAQGEPTRRIAGQLGISRETVETHIRAGMRKLGARTRTEAAALALEELA
jgi:DNA-binding CsgD family transcriptional regulator